MVNMKRMSNFIQRMFFRNQQFVIWSNSIFLEKETNFITRFYEILIRCLTRYDRIIDIASNYPLKKYVHVPDSEMSNDPLWVLEMEKHVQPCAFHQLPRGYKNPQRPYIHHDQTEN